MRTAGWRDSRARLQQLASCTGVGQPAPWARACLPAPVWHSGPGAWVVGATPEASCPTMVQVGWSGAWWLEWQPGAVCYCLLGNGGAPGFARNEDEHPVSWLPAPCGWQRHSLKPGLQLDLLPSFASGILGLPVRLSASLGVAPCFLKGHHTGHWWACSQRQNVPDLRFSHHWKPPMSPAHTSVPYHLLLISSLLNFVLCKTGLIETRGSCEKEDTAKAQSDLTSCPFSSLQLLNFLRNLCFPLLRCVY